MRVLVFRVGQAAVVEDVLNPFTFAQTSLLDGDDIETLTLDDGVVIYLGESGRRERPLNRHVPAKMPELPTDTNIINLTGRPLLDPGQMGVHDIHGNFLLTRHGAEECVDMTDADIAKYKDLSP